MPTALLTKFFSQTARTARRGTVRICTVRQLRSGTRRKGQRKQNEHAENARQTRQEGQDIKTRKQETHSENQTTRQKRRRRKQGGERGEGFLCTHAKREEGVEEAFTCRIPLVPETSVQTELDRQAGRGVMNGARLPHSLSPEKRKKRLKEGPRGKKQDITTRAPCTNLLHHGHTGGDPYLTAYIRVPT